MWILNVSRQFERGPLQCKFTGVNLVKHLTNTSIISLATQYLHILALLYAVGIPSRHYKNSAPNFSFLEFDEYHGQAYFLSDTTGQAVNIRYSFILCQ